MRTPGIENDSSRRPSCALGQTQLKEAVYATGTNIKANSNQKNQQNTKESLEVQAPTWWVS